MTRYLQSVALDAAIAQASKPLDGSLQSAMFSFDAEPGIVAADVRDRAAQSGATLASLLAAKFVLDRCEELPAIKAKLQPLFAELAEARAAEVEAARLASIARQAIRQDIEAKRQVALAAIEAEAAEKLAAVS
jgi:hypothetical protein